MAGRLDDDSSCAYCEKLRAAMMVYLLTPACPASHSVSQSPGRPLSHLQPQSSHLATSAVGGTRIPRRPLAAQHSRKERQLTKDRRALRSRSRAVLEHAGEAPTDDVVADMLS